MQMPEMDGMQLAMEIKGDAVLTSTKLILLTSLGIHDKTALERAGIEATLTKPVRQSDLYDVIMRVMKRSPETPAVPAAQADPVIGQEFGHIRILVAEDNIVNQKVAKRMLEKIGCTADVVADGIEAVHALSNVPYDLVLMDCQMPEMDGFEATRQIRLREEHGKHTVIVAMTANALQGDREKCLEAGMDDYISKPVRHTDLVTIIRRWMPMKNVMSADVSDARIVIDDASIIDTRRLYELSAIGGDDEPDLLRVLVMMFMNDSVKRIASIYSSLETDDLPKMTIAAHTLKGSAGNMGARLLVPTCAEIERLGKNQTMEGVAQLYTKLEADFSLVKGALERFLKEFYSSTALKKSFPTKPNP